MEMSGHTNPMKEALSPDTTSADHHQVVSLTERSRRDISEERSSKAALQVRAWEQDQQRLVPPELRLMALLGEAYRHEVRRLRSKELPKPTPPHTHQPAQPTQRWAPPGHSQSHTHPSAHPSAAAGASRSRRRPRPAHADPVQMAHGHQSPSALPLPPQAVADRAHDVLTCYQRLAHDGRRVIGSLLRAGKSGHAAAEQALAMHASLLPWSDGVLVDAPHHVATHMLLEKTAAVGRSGRLVVTGFNGTATAAAAKLAAPGPRKLAAVEAANRRLQLFRQQRADSVEGRSVDVVPSSTEQPRDPPTIVISANGSPALSGRSSPAASLPTSPTPTPRQQVLHQQGGFSSLAPPPRSPACRGRGRQRPADSISEPGISDAEHDDPARNTPGTSR